MNCEHMIPRYGEWHKTMKARGLDILGVHSPETGGERDRARLRRYVAEHAIAWPVVPDDDFAVWRTFGVSAWPTIILIDRQGRIAARFVGDDSSDAIARALDRLLGR